MQSFAVESFCEFSFDEFQTSLHCAFYFQFLSNIFKERRMVAAWQVHTTVFNQCVLTTFRQNRTSSFFRHAAAAAAAVLTSGECEYD